MAQPAIHNRGGQTIYSNYLITINSNRPNSAANRVQFVNKTREAIAHVLHMPVTFQWIVGMTAGGAQVANLVGANRTHIKRIRARCAFESGAAQNPAPHVHILLEIAHNTNIRVDYSEFTRLMRARYQVGPSNYTLQQANGMNFDFKLITNGVDNTLHYLLKTAHGPRDPPQHAEEQGLVNALQNNMANAVEPIFRTAGIAAGHGTDDALVLEQNTPLVDGERNV